MLNILSGILSTGESVERKAETFPPSPLPNIRLSICQAMKGYSKIEDGTYYTQGTSNGGQKSSKTTIKPHRQVLW